MRACFAPETGRLPPDRAALDASLAEHGWQGARLDQAAVTGFLTQCQLTDREIDAVIGTVLDGAFELEITADKLQLLLTLMPPEGGRSIEESDIAAAAASMGVVALLDSAAIGVALEAGSCEGREIARGVAPVQGEAARFDSMVQQKRPAQADNEDERVDLRDLGSLLLVNPGTALMRRTPAKPG
ncbi:flagellar assembly protein A, partial [Cupriavidus sp.]|uniref:flagellar assembly protein A n=1 Tax=Cupriavidus sp. TaxID=1873897 RepID=UPI0025C04275